MSFQISLQNCVCGLARHWQILKMVSYIGKDGGGVGGGRLGLEISAIKGFLYWGAMMLLWSPKPVSPYKKASQP